MSSFESYKILFCLEAMHPFNSYSNNFAVKIINIDIFYSEGNSNRHSLKNWMCQLNV